MNLNFKSRLILIFILLFSINLFGCSSAEPVLIDFHTEEQAEYLAGDYRLYKTYANGTEELSRPNAAVISVGEKYNGSVVLVSEKEDLTDARECIISDGELKVYNLKTATTYYYGSADCAKPKGSFVTAAAAPRNLYVEGVTNVRDLGGWCIEGSERAYADAGTGDTTLQDSVDSSGTADSVVQSDTGSSGVTDSAAKNNTGSSGTVRQGMIFRCGKLSADDTGETLITEEGIRVMREELKVRSEIDLRTVDDLENGGITVSPLGEDISYYSVPLESGGNIILLNRDSLKDIFEIFGDESNYPIVFHCSIGTDRTGMVAFLINGLLGVSEDDLYRDFLFSNFGEIGKMRAPSIIKTYIETVETAQGDTLSEKIYNYLVDAGVEAEDLDELIRIMTFEQ